MDKEQIDRIAVMRSERETINGQIETLKHKARDLSRQIAAEEGPIPDRSDRPREAMPRIEKTS